MKWSITQLRKYQGKPFEFNQTVNFEHLRESLDLIDLSDINVEGQLTVKSNEVIADMHVTGTYTMPCARTPLVQLMCLLMYLLQKYLI